MGKKGEKNKKKSMRGTIIGEMIGIVDVKSQTLTFCRGMQGFFLDTASYTQVFIEA